MAIVVVVVMLWGVLSGVGVAVGVGVGVVFVVSEVVFACVMLVGNLCVARGVCVA